MIDALRAIDRLRGAERIGALLRTTYVLRVFHYDELDRYASIVDERIAAGLWGLMGAPGDEPTGGGQRRVRRGPTDAVIDRAAHALARRLAAARKDQRPEHEADLDRTAISTVLSFLGLAPYRAAGLARPHGDTKTERLGAARRRREAARRRASRVS